MDSIPGVDRGEGGPENPEDQGDQLNSTDFGNTFVDAARTVWPVLLDAWEDFLDSAVYRRMATDLRTARARVLAPRRPAASHQATPITLCGTWPSVAAGGVFLSDKTVRRMAIWNAVSCFLLDAEHVAVTPSTPQGVHTRDHLQAAVYELIQRENGLNDPDLQPDRVDHVRPPGGGTAAPCWPAGATHAHSVHMPWGGAGGRRRSVGCSPRWPAPLHRSARSRTNGAWWTWRLATSCTWSAPT